MYVSVKQCPECNHRVYAGNYPGQGGKIVVLYDRLAEKKLSGKNLAKAPWGYGPQQEPELKAYGREEFGKFRDIYRDHDCNRYKNYDVNEDHDPAQHAEAIEKIRCDLESILRIHDSLDIPELMRQIKQLEDEIEDIKPELLEPSVYHDVVAQAEQLRAEIGAEHECSHCDAKAGEPCWNLNELRQGRYVPKKGHHVERFRPEDKEHPDYQPVYSVLRRNAVAQRTIRDKRSEIVKLHRAIEKHQNREMAIENIIGSLVQRNLKK